MWSCDGRNDDGSWLWVKKNSGTGYCWVITSAGEIFGDLNGVKIIASPGLPPTSTLTSIPQDNLPPVISGVTVNPTVVSVLAACGATPATTIITASVADDRDVQSVITRIPGVGEFQMQKSGGVYQATLGPFGEVDTLN